MNPQPADRQRRRAWWWWLVPVIVGTIQFGGIRWAGRWQAPHHRRWDEWQPDQWPADRMWAEPASLPITSYLVAMIGPVALFWSRRYPRSVIAITAVSSAVYYLLDLGGGPVFLSVVVAVALWAFQLRAERLSEARRAMTAEAAQRAEAKRLAVAQELHDVLAHHISLISVQSGVALHLIDERPEQTRQALTAIKGASKEALAALRGALDSLRDHDSAAPRHPTGGLAQLDDLVESVRGTGITVTVERPRPLPPRSPLVDLTALRIVQESLTNVLRHAEATAVTVVIGTTDDELTVQVRDNGIGGVVIPGNGLSGIVERAAAVGGTARYGPAHGGGFEVTARLPVTVES